MELLDSFELMGLPHIVVEPDFDKLEALLEPNIVEVEPQLGIAEVELPDIGHRSTHIVVEEAKLDC